MTPTPFESTGTVTPYGAVLTWLTDLAASADRLRVDTIGLSVEGLPIVAATIGGSGPVGLMVVAGQHGEESGSYESAMPLIRDLAETTDPALSAYLAAHPVVVVPCVNPDRLRATRENANGLDLNREHLTLSQPETYALATLITQRDPDVLLDLHENYGQPNGEDVQMSYSRTAQAHAAVRSLSQGLYARVEEGLAAKGMRAEPYPTPSPIGSLASTGSLRHMVTLLVEGDSTKTIPHRITLQRTCVDAALDFHRTGVATIVETRATAKAEKTAEGAAGTTPFVVSDALTITPPTAYTLTSEQARAFARQRTGLGIKVERVRGMWEVDMAQVAQPIIPFVIDPGAVRPVVVARRGEPGIEARAEDLAGFYVGPYVKDGVECPVVSLAVMVDGYPHPVTQRHP